jgi:hypothetical protein
MVGFEGATAILPWPFCHCFGGADLKSPHFLRASNNVRQMRANLVVVLSPAELKIIDDEITKNAAQLFRLGASHYNFAKRQNARAWRQKVSRLYYAAYNISRAIRLWVKGEFATDVGDHKRVDLPDDFPDRNTYSNRLSALRDDRNLCDYDHTARARDLIEDAAAWLKFVTKFERDARAYLRSRGVLL